MLGKDAPWSKPKWSLGHVLPNDHVCASDNHVVEIEPYYSGAPVCPLLLLIITLESLTVAVEFSCSIYPYNYTHFPL